MLLINQKRQPSNLKIISFFVPKSNALDTDDISSVQFKSMQVKLENNQTSTRALDIEDQKLPTLLTRMLKQCLCSRVFKCLASGSRK